ncbi:sensor histidine kinase [Streptomyces sp. NPDC056227]|uniref:sensor histidine kinase n=1 Tax=Streptomyces sp. NPDC056227 TaxID=3345753 RepID=UPI0035D92CE8
MNRADFVERLRGGLVRVRGGLAPRGPGLAYRVSGDAPAEPGLAQAGAGLASAGDRPAHRVRGPVRDGPARLKARVSVRPGDPRLVSRWSWAADVILAVFLSAATVNIAGNSVRFAPKPLLVPKTLLTHGAPQTLSPPQPPGFGGPQFIAVHMPLWLLALAALTALPLVVRRSFPLVAYWAVLGTTVAYHFAAQSYSGVDDTAVFTFIACLIAAYSAAIYSPYRQAMVRSLIAGAVLLVIFHPDNIPSITPGFVPFALLIPGGLAANTIHTWRQRVSSLQAEQEAATLLAVERERARIARELHDVVTHNVSMMTVQAGAARKVMDRSPELALQALLAVEAGGRAAMSELRHAMGLLTMPSDPSDPSYPTDPDDPAAAELAPQPGLGQVAVLAGRIRDAGVPVELVVSGTPLPLPPGVDLAGYRVVQEALTNTVKHAAGAAVTITVDHRPDELRIEVADTGGTRAPAMAGNGRGLIGLRERLSVYGGTLDAGRRISGGYRVRAVIPVGEA